MTATKFVITDKCSFNLVIAIKHQPILFNIKPLIWIYGPIGIRTKATAATCDLCGLMIYEYIYEYITGGLYLHTVCFIPRLSCKHDKEKVKLIGP